MKKILFVCTGNTCRSPMAAGLARRILDKAGLQVEVASAGLCAWPGSCASPEALRAMKDEGIDLSGHRTRQLVPEEVAEADLILTMTAAQKRRLLQDYPAANGKVYLLKEYAAGVDQAGDRLAESLKEAAEAKDERFLPDQVWRCELELSGYDICDPFGGSAEDYRACATELRHALEQLVGRLAKEQGQ